MGNCEISKEKMEEITKDKKPFVTISFYDIDKDHCAAEVHFEEKCLGAFDLMMFKQAVVALGDALGSARSIFLEEVKRKEEANSVKC